ncbi:MAG: hypothetical protein J7559_11885 [Cohnella sp.]|nr:hypothetical protein [Cohnella sp.]
MSVRAKFKVDSIKKFLGGNEVSLKPVYDSNKESENGRFYSYTPSGSITLSIVPDATADRFEVGKEYYVDFTLAE